MCPACSPPCRARTAASSRGQESCAVQGRGEGRWLRHRGAAPAPARCSTWPCGPAAPPSGYGSTGRTSAARPPCLRLMAPLHFPLSAPPTWGLPGRTQGKPEAVDARAVRRLGRDAVRRPAKCRVEAPTAATVHPVRAPLPHLEAARVRRRFRSASITRANAGTPWVGERLAAHGVPALARGIGLRHTPVGGELGTPYCPGGDAARARRLG